MPEAKRFVFTHKEVVEALAKYQGVTKGTWKLYVEFGLAGADVQSPNGTHPTAIVPITKLGITEAKAESDIAVSFDKQTKTKKSKSKKGSGKKT